MATHCCLEAEQWSWLVLLLFDEEGKERNVVVNSRIYKVTEGLTLAGCGIRETRTIHAATSHSKAVKVLQLL